MEHNRACLLNNSFDVGNYLDECWWNYYSNFNLHIATLTAYLLWNRGKKNVSNKQRLRQNENVFFDSTKDNKKKKKTLRENNSNFNLTYFYLHWIITKQLKMRFVSSNQLREYTTRSTGVSWMESMHLRNEDHKNCLKKGNSRFLNKLRIHFFGGWAWSREDKWKEWNLKIKTLWMF